MLIQITPLSSAIGGLTLGSSVLFFRLCFGRVLGISGLFSKIFDSTTKDTSFRIAFTAGLVSAGLLLPTTPVGLPTDILSLMFSGFLVGFGTTMGSGCTSGHGLVGLSRFSIRSWIAVPTFMLSAMVTRSFLTTETFTTVAPVIVNEISTKAEYVIGSCIGLLSLGYGLSYFKKSKNMTWIIDGLSFLSGHLFGVGLIVSGMVVPAKVAAFLSFPNMFYSRPIGTFAAFDPSLMIVMVAGMLPNVVANPIINRNLSEPLLTETCQMPTNNKITRKLIIGSSLFGIGWGISGLCPGPALVQFSRIALGEYEVVKWLIAFIIGSKIANCF